MFSWVLKLIRYFYSPPPKAEVAAEDIAIVESYIVGDNVQVDGRRHVCEHHLINDGSVVIVNYMAEPEADVETIKNNRHTIVVDQLMRDKVIPQAP